MPIDRTKKIRIPVTFLNSEDSVLTTLASQCGVSKAALVRKVVVAHCIEADASSVYDLVVPARPEAK